MNNVELKSFLQNIETRMFLVIKNDPLSRLLCLSKISYKFYIHNILVEYILCCHPLNSKTNKTEIYKKIHVLVEKKMVTLHQVLTKIHILIFNKIFQYK